MGSSLIEESFGLTGAYTVLGGEVGYDLATMWSLSIFSPRLKEPASEFTCTGCRPWAQVFGAGLGVGPEGSHPPSQVTVTGLCPWDMPLCWVVTIQPKQILCLGEFEWETCRWGQ